MLRFVRPAASAAFVFVALVTTQMSVAAQPSAPAGAAKGYTLPTKDGRCAMWVSSEVGPQPGESTTWSGACKNGMGHGFGIQDLVLADQRRVRYVGHVRNGRWHGLGRQHLWDPEGRLVFVTEGVFENDVEQGVFNELVLDHPSNGALDGFRPRGRDVGSSAVQVRQFYTDGAAVLLCGRDADCLHEAAEEGHAPKDSDLGEGMNRLLPFGGWEFEIRSGEQSERTGHKLQMGEPLSLGMCLEEAKVRKGSEPRRGALLFPSFTAWQAYLRSDQQCSDVSAVMEGHQLTWKSQCQPASKAELVSITQQRSVGDKDMRSQMEVVVTQGGKPTARVTKNVTARFVGACTDDMMKAGQLGL